MYDLSKEEIYRQAFWKKDTLKQIVKMNIQNSQCFGSMANYQINYNSQCGL